MMARASIDHHEICKREGGERENSQTHTYTSRKFCKQDLPSTWNSSTIWYTKLNSILFVNFFVQISSGQFSVKFYNSSSLLVEKCNIQTLHEILKKIDGYLKKINTSLLCEK